LLVWQLITRRLNPGRRMDRALLVSSCLNIKTGHRP
jgi:hypothetical protein